MAMPCETTNRKTPSQGEPFVIPSFGNDVPPLMAMLSLLGLTIRLPIYLFSSRIIPSAPIVSNTKSPSQEHQHHVDLSPSSPNVSSSLSPSSPIKSCEASNQVDKKKKKRNIKKKKYKREIKYQPTTPQ